MDSEIILFSLNIHVPAFYPNMTHLLTLVSSTIWSLLLQVALLQHVGRKWKSFIMTCLAEALQQIPNSTSVQSPLSFFTTLIFTPPIPSHSFLSSLHLVDHITPWLHFYLLAWTVRDSESMVIISLTSNFMLCPVSYSSGFSALLLFVQQYAFI